MRKLLFYIPVAIVAWIVLSGVCAVIYVANSDLSKDFKDGDTFSIYPFTIEDSAAKYVNSRARTCAFFGHTIVETVQDVPQP